MSFDTLNWKKKRDWRRNLRTGRWRKPCGNKEASGVRSNSEKATSATLSIYIESRQIRGCPVKWPISPSYEYFMSSP